MSNKMSIYTKFNPIHPFHYNLEPFYKQRLYYSFRNDWNEKHGYCTFTNKIPIKNCECEITAVVKLDVVDENNAYKEDMIGRELWCFAKDDNDNNYIELPYHDTWAKEYEYVEIRMNGKLYYLSFNKEGEVYYIYKYYGHLPLRFLFLEKVPQGIEQYEYINHYEYKSRNVNFDCYIPQNEMNNPNRYPLMIGDVDLYPKLGQSSKYFFHDKRLEYNKVNNQDNNNNSEHTYFNDEWTEYQDELYQDDLNFTNQGYC